VWCGRKFGITIYHAGVHVSLNFGVNEHCDRTIVAAWLASNRHLQIVKNGTVRIIERMAIDSGIAK
jgi:hypothetical protein